MELTEERKVAFLRELAQHGVVARAARAASPHSPEGCERTFRDERSRDVQFALAWEDAMSQARAAIEYELHRRAVEGWEEPIFGGRYRERIVGTVRKYSDRLLELRVRALLPGYREHLHVDSRIEHMPSLGLDQLSPESRADLRRILERENADTE